VDSSDAITGSSLGISKRLYAECGFRLTCLPACSFLRPFGQCCDRYPGEWVSQIGFRSSEGNSLHQNLSLTNWNWLSINPYCFVTVPNPATATTRIRMFIPSAHGAGWRPRICRDTSNCLHPMQQATASLQSSDLGK
jgi:hypothetical protein